MQNFFATGPGSGTHPTNQSMMAESSLSATPELEPAAPPGHSLTSGQKYATQHLYQMLPPHEQVTQGSQPSLAGMAVEGGEAYYPMPPGQPMMAPPPVWAYQPLGFSRSAERLPREAHSRPHRSGSLDRARLNVRKAKRSRSLSKSKRLKRRFATISPESRTDRDRRLRGLKRAASISPARFEKSRARRLAKFQSQQVIKSGRLVAKREHDRKAVRELPFR